MGKNFLFFLGQEKIILTISKIIVFILVFLIPLFFLPWTSSVLDFNKQALLIFLVFLALVLLLLNFLRNNRLEINTSFVNIPIFILFLSLVVSNIFSLSRYGSFWGWPLTISSSVLSFLGFIFFYFLVVNLFKKEEIVFILFFLFLSGFFVAIHFIFQAFGVFVLPFDFTKNNFFNLIGTTNTLGIYFAVLFLLLLPLFYSAKGIFKLFLGIVGLIFLFVLFLINVKIVWLTFLSGLLGLFAFGIINLNKSVSTGFITLLMVLLVFASLMFFFRFSLIKSAQFPSEILVSHIDNLKIFKSLPLKSLIIGTGPGTFAFDWARYKPAEINQKNFWNWRFERGSSEMLDRLVTTGLVGFLSFLFLIVILLKKNFSFLLKKENSLSQENEDNLDLFLGRSMLAGFWAIVFALFFYPFNFSLFFLFWLIVSCLVLLGKGKRKTFDFNVSKVSALSFSFLFVLILVFGIGIFIIYSQNYFAEVKYVQGISAFRKGNTQEALNFINQAINLNPNMDLYKRDFSQASILRLEQVLLDPKLSPEEKQQTYTSLIIGAINTINEATKIEPNNSLNWRTRAFVYQKTIGILKGAEDWALTTYQEALNLEPNSPDVLTEIGRIYLSKADLLAQQGLTDEVRQNYTLARGYLEKAIQLKSDYASARFLLASTDIKEGKIQEAITKLEETQRLAPLDAGLAFQIGVLYFNNNQIDQAQTQFEKAIAIDPNYSNARYFLGLIYDKKENKKAAIEQFEVIEKFNPDNQEVKKILDNLRNNRPALEGILPSQPPLSE